MSIENIIKTGLEDIQKCFNINVDLFSNYYLEEIKKNEDLVQLMNRRDNNFDWVKETPLGGAGTTLNSVVLYCLVRYFDMVHVIETGVSGGYYTAFVLAALNTNNNYGSLCSLELSDNKSEVGKLVPKLKLNEGVGWDLRLGRSSLDYFKDWKNETITHNAELYLHDSLHTRPHMLKELLEFKKCTNNKFFIFIDDQDSEGFWAWCKNAGQFNKIGYNVKYISGQESRLGGHLGGFIKYDKA
jgi:hypothetical protein